MSGQGDAATFEPYQRMGIESGGFMRLEYNFVSLARRFAVGLTVAMWVVPLLPVVAEYVVHPVAFAVQIFIATCMGVIELPFCCTGLAFCRRLQPWMAPFETYWLRAVLYLVFGVTLGLVDWYVDDKSNLQLWIYSVLLAVLAILYLLAYLNGERSAEEWENDPVESTGVGGGSWLPSWPWSSSSAPETLSGEEQAKHDLDLQRQALRAAMATAMKF